MHAMDEWMNGWMDIVVSQSDDYSIDDLLATKGGNTVSASSLRASQSVTARLFAFHSFSASDLSPKTTTSM
jgi:hypothetical protein